MEGGKGTCSMYACIHVTPSCGDRNRFRYARHFKLVFWGFRESVDQLMNLASPHIGISAPIPSVIAALGYVPGVSNLLTYLLTSSVTWDSKNYAGTITRFAPTQSGRKFLHSIYIDGRVAGRCFVTPHTG